MPCTACSMENPPQAEFCLECGHPIPVAGVAPTPPAAPQTYTPRHLAEKILAGRAALEGERKQVTILFADVVGSTELIHDRDPEDAQRLLDGAVKVMMDAVHRYEGTVSRLTGDGLMALFGAPLDHEDHAVRACYAALGMQEAARRYGEEARPVYGVAPAIRVGLSAGEVVRTIHDDLHMDYTAMGQTVHLAARMEQLAKPDTTALTPETMALVDGYVEVRSLGRVPVKGVPEPIEVFELLGVGTARTRLEAAATRGLTRFVGRDAEIDTLYAALARADGGHGQVVGLVGEPGVGKSRLVWELTHSDRARDWLILESGSVSYGKATSWLPVIDLLKAYCRIERRDDDRLIRERLTGKLLALDEELRPALPALLALLDVSADDSAWDALDPGERRRQTLDAVKRLFLLESRKQPLLLVFEDLHWIDSETQALLDSLVESLPTSRIMLLVNFRPEYAHTWGNRSFYTQLRIDPLVAGSADAVLAALLGDDASLVPLKALLTERTEGNPLFLEESVRSLAETGALVGERGAYRLLAPPETIRVPATVQAVIAARIDRLPAEEKQLLQTAAVVGKDVPDALLRVVSDRDEGALRRGLAALRAAEFLYEASVIPELEYTFKHALTHEVAYGSLLQDRRRALHGRIVDAIEQLYANRQVEQIERLAHHALRAEDWARAATYARAAGRKAETRPAYREAVAFYEQAAAALQRLPETRDTLEQAIDLRLELKISLINIAEWDQIGKWLDEAAQLADRLGDPYRQGQVLAVTGHYVQQTGDHERAIELSERALAIAARLGEERLEIEPNRVVGQVHHSLGRFDRAIESFRRNVRLLDTDPAVLRGSRLPPDAVVSRAWLARCLAAQGKFAEAKQIGAEAVEIARAAEHSYSEAIAACYLGYIYLQQGDVSHAIPLLEQCVELWIAWDARLHLTGGAGALALAYALSGRGDEALALIDRTDLRSGLHRISAAYLVEAYVAAGALEEAVPLVNGAWEIARTRGQPEGQARFLLLLGEIAARYDPPDFTEAEQRYREALALTTACGMRPLQAHGHLGLGKEYRRMARLDEARAELSAAVAMLREMGMAYWLPEAEAELAQAIGSS